MRHLYKTVKVLRVKRIMRFYTFLFGRIEAKVGISILCNKHTMVDVVTRAWVLQSVPWANVL